jgi:hypothetical protein
MRDRDERAKIAQGFKELANELAAAPDPVPPRRAGREPAVRPLAGYASRVLADIAKRREQGGEG